MHFPKRFRHARPPEYPDLVFKVLANPDGKLYQRLLGDASTEERSADLGAALSEAYGGEIVEGYGAKLDFSTAAGAIAAVTNEDLPIDLRAWIRNAPIDLISYERETLIAGNFQASLIPGK